jgi:hypothetical protein
MSHASGAITNISQPCLRRIFRACFGCNRILANPAGAVGDMIVSGFLFRTLSKIWLVVWIAASAHADSGCGLRLCGIGTD